ncbi:sulfatase family protein [Cerasicoccus frondis]|uniref:sulfatase family protein n=1 Tax=Cerasicoccus frondis TaxID=490090 RepID=UPI0028529CB0|nr:sulfatase-like hydrolase/transferase [Cerasicoccus frondis]
MVRSNLLVIMTDQQCADALGCASGGNYATPNLDRLAARGVRFEKAYTSQPICVPARCSMLTGLMPHQTGVTYNVSAGSMQGAPLSRLIDEAGYDTAYIGKWHIEHDPADQDWHGFRTTVRMQGNNLDANIEEPIREFLLRDREQPFFLFASFVNPHDICEVARMIAGQEEHYKNGEIPPFPPPHQCPPLPANFAIPPNEPSVIREHQQELRGGEAMGYIGATFDEGQWRQYRWAYQQLVSLVDARIGRLLDALEESGQANNTAIVFFSDHGDGNGAHQWHQKNIFYEESARVPFILVPPGGCPTAENHEALVNACLDLFPTLLDYAGLPTPADRLGRSLKPILEGRSVSQHDYVVSQTNLHLSYGAPGPTNGRMLRTADYKYVCFDSGSNREQLFHLPSDPGETHSLANDPHHAETLRAHRQLLQEWIERTEDPFQAT